MAYAHILLFVVQEDGLPRANKVRVSEQSVHSVRGHLRSAFPEHSPAQAHTRTHLHTHTLCTPSGAHRAHTFANPLCLRPAGPPQTAVCSSGPSRKRSHPSTVAAWTAMPSRCQTEIICSWQMAAPSRESSGRGGGYTEGKGAERRQRCQGSCSKVCVCVWGELHRGGVTESMTHLWAGCGAGDPED